MTKDSHSGQLLDHAEIDQAIDRAKALRAAIFRTCFRAFIGFIRTLPTGTFSGEKTFKSSNEWKESSQINAS